MNSETNNFRPYPLKNFKENNIELLRIVIILRRIEQKTLGTSFHDIIVVGVCVYTYIFPWIKKALTAVQDF